METGFRTHTCGELRLSDNQSVVTLCGWVQRTRDKGRFIFVDLRDRYGITQITILSDTEPELYQKAKSLGREDVIRVQGKVVIRENPNTAISTGAIEVRPHSLEILCKSELPPFLIEDATDGSEELRMRYRYLDLRRPVMQQRLLFRAKTVRAVRDYLDRLGFCEIETPNLIKSTPEGARDFLIPSRLQPGNFYALPQSPQILKQLLMVAGMDRYYQICKCYRDEDFRGDRQPEFTQIDCEMAFASQEDILQTFEGMTRYVFEQVLAVTLPPFQRLTYQEVMQKYGTDKPDLRFDMPIQSLNELIISWENIVFQPFAQTLQENGLIAALVVPQAAAWSRKETDKLTELVKSPKLGGKGLFTLRYQSDQTLKSSADSAFTPQQLKAIVNYLNASAGDLILVVVDSVKKAQKIMGELRLAAAQKLGLRDTDLSKWSVFWVIDFPLFEADPETGQPVATHHPFVMPNPEDIHLIDTDPLKVRAYCYDLVINGNEILSGSVRIHQPALQDKIFELLGLSVSERQEKFGFLLNAFRYGAPPHAGCAFGLDRWVMLMTGSETIRDVIAFPKSSSGRDLMLDAPGTVDKKILDELGIEVKLK